MGLFDDLEPKNGIGAPKSAPARQGLFDDLMPSATKQPEPESDELVNTAAGFGRGVAKGVIGAPGLPGDIANLWGAAGDWARSKGYLPPIPEGSVFAKKLPGSQDIIEAAKPYVPALGEKTEEGLPRLAETVGEFVPMAGRSLVKNALAPGAAVYGAERAAESGNLPSWAPLAAAPLATATAAGVSALARRPSAAQRMVQEATKGITPEQAASAEQLFNDAREAGLPLTRAEAAQEVTQGATGLGDLQRVTEGLGGLKPFFAQRAGHVERAGRDYLDTITPANMEPSQIGPRVGEAAKTIIGETPEGQRLANAVWAAGPRTTAEEAGAVIQPQLHETMARREAMRNALATPEYEAARNAPATIPMDGGFGFRDVTKHYDMWPVTRDAETGRMRRMTQEEINAATEQYHNLKSEVEGLREEAAPMRGKDIRESQRQEIEGVFPKEHRLPVEVAIGARQLPEVPSLLNWMAKEGGIYDARGDVRSILGGKRVKGLIKDRRDNIAGGARGLDDWAEKIYNDFPEHFPEGRPSPHDVEGWIADAAAGHPPKWWVGDERLALDRDVQNYRDLFDHLGVKPKSLGEAAEAVRGYSPLRERLHEKARAAGDLPWAEEALAGRKQVADELQAGVRGTRNVTERMPVIGLEPTKFGQVNVSNVARVLDAMQETAKGGIKASLAKARKTLNTPSGELDASVSGIHNARVAIDDLIEQAKREGNNNAARQLLETKAALDKSLETVPEYARAVETYKNASEPLKPFEHPAVSKAVQRDEFNKDFETPKEQVPGAIEKGGASAAQAFSEVASPEVRNSYVNHLATKILDDAGRAGIDLDSQAMRQYMAKNEDALRRFPELVDRLTEIANARDDLERLKVTPIGKLLGKQDVRDAANALFPQNPHPNSEAEIERALTSLAKTDPKTAKDLVRYYIESTFNQATRDLQGGPSQFGGATFAAKIGGNEQSRKNIVAAVRAVSGKDVASGFERMLDIMQATGQRQRIGSQTSFNNELNRLMKEGNTPEEAAKLIAGFGVKWPERIKTKWDEWTKGRNVEEVARLLTDPKEAETFRRLALRQKTPGVTQNLVGRLLLSSMTANEARKERASGGRVEKRDYPAKKASRLDKQANAVRKALGGALMPIMDLPDHVVANALRVAKS